MDYDVVLFVVVTLTLIANLVSLGFAIATHRRNR